MKTAGTILQAVGAIFAILSVLLSLGSVFLGLVGEDMAQDVGADFGGGLAGGLIAGTVCCMVSFPQAIALIGVGTLLNWVADRLVRRM